MLLKTHRAIIGLLIFSASVAAAGVDARISTAAMNRDSATVRALLAEKVDINAAQGDGTTALHWSAYNDDLELAKMLVASGANPNVKTRLGGITPLHMAAKNGSAAMIEVLLKAGADLTIATATGTTP